ncbi:MAG: RNA methyltransferase [Saprospiraceae bacterium]|nr:RNA methyltransferase [Saprospiraceae bacterium]
MKKYLDFLSYGTVEPDIISTKEMEQISTLKTPSDIFLLLDKREDDTNILLNDHISAIYLDGVQDPGNVGTIIRTADWFGIDMIIRSEESADFFNPKVVQASMGSMANLLLTTADYKKISSFKRPMYGTYIEGKDLQTTVIEEFAILVMGSEGKGISAEMDNWIQHKITIGGAKNKLAESLNVSVAAGIICAHWKKWCSPLFWDTCHHTLFLNNFLKVIRLFMSLKRKRVKIKFANKLRIHLIFGYTLIRVLIRHGYLVNQSKRLILIAYALVILSCMVTSYF